MRQGDVRPTLWQGPPHTPSLGAGQLDLWRYRIDAAIRFPDRFSDILSSDELERAARLKTTPLQSAFVQHRLMLRRILARYLSLSPAAVVFRYGPHGKPYLQEAGGAVPEFNLSHSCSRGALSVSILRAVQALLIIARSPGNFSMPMSRIA